MEEKKKFKLIKMIALMTFMLLVAFAKSNDVKAAEKLKADKVITGEENFQLRIDKNDYVCKFQPRITGEYEFTFNTVFYNETDKAGVNDGKAEIYGVIYDEDFEEISTFCIDEEYTYYLLAFKGKSYYFAYKTSDGLYDITTNIDLIKIDIESYKFRVSCHGNPARDLNDLDNVKFDEKNMVLKLNNYSGSGFVFGVGFSNRSSIVYGPEKKRKYYLYSLKDYLSNRTIKVVVNGKNKFVGDHYDKYMFGAVGGLSLEFVGNGILEKRDPVTSNGLTYTNYDMVCLDGSITVDGPTIDITSIEVDESFNMKSGKVIVYEGIDAKNASFTGGKIVAITDNNRFKGFIDVTSKIVFDGTDFELAPKVGSDRWLQPDTIFEAKEIIIKKGNIRLKLIPIYYILIGDNGEKQGLDYCGFSDVFICETLSISGGNLMIEYDKFRNEPNITEDTFNKGRGNCIFNVGKELNIKNFNL
ncbi:hypothetical protein, partial [Eubacterium sp.]|uniref:hypothetical protein n=1 Tax=Eubacterium sp. TaxID=142586 RepID=UPI0025ED2E40